MKLDKKHKPEKALGKEGRFQVEHAKLDGSNLIATDGRILAVIPVEVGENDRDGLIPKDALTGCRKGLKGRQVPTLICGEAVTLHAQGIRMDRPAEDKFPPWEEVIPAEDEYEAVREIRLNARLLYNLAQALGTDELKLTFQGVGAVRADAIDGEAYGVIMPLRM